MQYARPRPYFAPHTIKIQVEVEDLAELKEAIEARADAILLDNMTPELMRQAAAITQGRIPLEASGGVTLERVAELSRLGVDVISVGALTHSAPALDVALELI